MSEQPPLPRIVLPYRLEALWRDTWTQTAQDHSMLYLQGLAEGWASVTPRVASRLVRAKDGKVLREWSASDRPPIGAVCGWPTPDQRIRAAVSALRGVPDRSGGVATPAELEGARRALAALTGKAVTFRLSRAATRRGRLGSSGGPSRPGRGR